MKVCDKINNVNRNFRLEEVGLTKIKKLLDDSLGT